MQPENKNFLMRTAIFVVALIITIFIVNTIYFHLFTDKKQLYRNEADFENYLKDNNITKLSTIFLGSSHTKDGANPHFINNSFNIASGGEATYILGYYKTRKILEQDKVDIENLVIEIDPHVLNDRVYPRPITIENLWYWSHFFNYNEIKNFTALGYPDYLAQSKLYFINGAKDFDIFFAGQLFSETYRGWAPNLLNLSDDPNPKDYSYQYYKVTFANTEERLNPTGADYLLRIANLAQAHNITLFLIKYPLPKEYTETLAENGFKQSEYDQNIYDLLDSQNVTYHVLDYQNIYNSTSYFGDPGHLNEATSGPFTAQVAKDITKIRQNATYK